MQKKVVLITGSSRGIGFATALKFGMAGYSVAINGVDAERGRKALSELTGKGIDAEFFQADVTNDIKACEMLSKIEERFGRLDCLVNNAGGLGGRCKVDVMTDAFYDNVMDLNMRSVFNVTRASIPLLKASKGTIVNITSIAGRNGGGPGATIYAAAKAALLGFTRGLSKELIPDGIRVNAVAPGTIDTDFHSATTAEAKESWKKAIPSGRFGTDSEVANVIFFVASGEAGFIVGEEIQVNGGQQFF